MNYIDGVRHLVSVLASCTVDRGFEPRSGQTVYYKTRICSFSANAKYKALRRKKKDRLARSESGN